MIDEAMGKILGMAMAYAVSSFGLLLAYVNYRKRVLKAERAMSGTAWTVIGVVVIAAIAAWFAVLQLSEPPTESDPVVVADNAPIEEETVPAPEPLEAEPGSPKGERSGWSMLGVVIPASIFLIATWLTAALHRHFSQPAPSRD